MKEVVATLGVKCVTPPDDLFRNRSESESELSTFYCFTKP